MYGFVLLVLPVLVGTSIYTHCVPLTEELPSLGLRRGLLMNTTITVAYAPQAANISDLFAFVKKQHNDIVFEKINTQALG